MTFDPSHYLNVSSRTVVCACNEAGETEELTFTPKLLYFDYLQAGEVSDWQPFTISNTGTLSVGISSLVITGEFELSGVVPAALAPGESATFQVRFKPLANGARFGDVIIHAGTAEPQDCVHVIGVGGNPNVSVGWSDVIDDDPINNPKPIPTSDLNAPFGSRNVGQIISDADSLLAAHNSLVDLNLSQFQQHEALLYLDGVALGTVIADEKTARIDGDAAIAATLALIGAKSADNLAFILDANTVKVSDTQSLAQKFSVLSAETTQVQTNLDAQVTTLSQAITDEESARASQYTSIETSLVNEAGLREAAVTNLSTAITDGDSANATSINQVKARLDNWNGVPGQTAEAKVTSVDQARIDGDNALSSHITTVETTANGASSNATFAISALNGNEASIAMLTYAGGVMNGIRIGGVTQSVVIQGTMHSSNFVTGSAGWKINEDGSAEFNGVVLSRNQILSNGSTNFGYVDTHNTSSYGPLVDPSFALIERWVDTGLTMASWMNSTGPLVAAATVAAGSVVSVDGTWFNDASWGVKVDMIPRIRYAGAATLMLRFTFYGVYIVDFNPMIIDWVVYKVT